MKTILVDAINTFVIKENGIFQEMHDLLEKYPNPKIIVTNANDEQINFFKLDQMPYPLFTQKHNPKKSDPNYFRELLKEYNLEVNSLCYFEHNADAVKSTESIGITSYHYNPDLKDLNSLKAFLDRSLLN